MFLHYYNVIYRLKVETLWIEHGNSYVEGLYFISNLDFKKYRKEESNFERPSDFFQKDFLILFYLLKKTNHLVFLEQIKVLQLSVVTIDKPIFLLRLLIKK